MHGRIAIRSEATARAAYARAQLRCQARPRHTRHFFILPCQCQIAACTWPASPPPLHWIPLRPIQRVKLYSYFPLGVPCLDMVVYVTGNVWLHDWLYVHSRGKSALLAGGDLCTASGSAAACFHRSYGVAVHRRVTCW
jgi:hypothetical protein